MSHRFQFLQCLPFHFLNLYRHRFLLQRADCTNLVECDILGYWKSSATIKKQSRLRSSSIETKTTVDVVQALHEKNKHVSVRVRVVSVWIYTGMKRILSVAILPEVDFSLGNTSKGIWKQLIWILALNLNMFKNFQEGWKIPTPLVLVLLLESWSVTIGRFLRQ